MVPTTVLTKKRQFSRKKMCLSILLVSLSTFSVGSIASSLQMNHVTQYGSLIKAAYHKHNCAGVIILADTNNLSLKRMTVWQEATRVLSIDGISTLVTGFDQVQDMLNAHNAGGYGNPLIVATPGSIRSLQLLELFVKNVTMESANWLVIFRKTSDDNICQYCRNPQGNGLNLKFNAKVLVLCCDSTTIEEWWSIKKTDVKRQEVGRFSDDNLGIDWLPDSVVNHRRRNLDGQGLRIAVMKGFDFNENQGDYSGILGEIFKEMLLAINFTVGEILWEETDGMWDTATSTWTGVIGRVSRGEADIGIAEYVMTLDRNEAVEFMSPISFGSFHYHVRKLDNVHLSWNAYYKVFCMKVWIAIITVILTTPVLLTCMNYSRVKPALYHQLSEQYLRVWGIYCGQGLSGSSAGTPLRLAYISIALPAFVVLSVYSASMMSTIAVSSSDVPFKTVEEFIKDGTYELIVLRHGVHHNLLKVSNNTIRKQLKSLLKPEHSLPTTYKEGFQQVCDDRVAFWTYEKAKRPLSHNISCTFSSFPNGKTGSRSWIMPKNTEYIEPFNYHIQRFSFNGMFRRLERKYYEEPVELEEHKHPPVHLQAVIPLICILFIGLLMSLTIFISERIHSLGIKLPDWRRQMPGTNGNIVPLSRYPYFD